MTKKRTGEAADPTTDVFAVLEDLTGSVEAPVDWSVEHDHYLYGTTKRGELHRITPLPKPLEDDH
jgi:hypothetical protein